MKNLFFICTLLMGVLSMDAQIQVSTSGFCIDGTYNSMPDQDGRPAYSDGFGNAIRWSAADNHWRIGSIDISQPALYTNNLNSLEPPCSSTQAWDMESGSCGAVTVTSGGSTCGTMVLATTHYVNKTASGANDGTSWGDAYTDLQPAIDAANAGDEIWVAAGTYKPTVEFDADESGGTNDRERTFYINQDGIKIYGGFAGTETILSQRPAGAKSTLSGDFMSNDVFDVNNGGYQGTTGDDNAYHVVYVDGTSSPVTIATVIDGFSIVEGNADGGFQNREGGGIYNDGGNGGNSSPSIANCSFSNNSTDNFGGGVFNNGDDGNSSPTIANCSFSNNNADDFGGGIYNDGNNTGNSSPTIANCSFSNNSGGDFGGGICNSGNSTGNSSPTITNCSFSNNIATNGGGICYFGNSGILKSQIVNCLFNSNGAEHIYYSDGNADQQPHFINCTFTGATTRVMSQVMDNGMTPVDFTNCIFWNNGGDITDLANSNVNINHSLIEEAGFTGGMNNIIAQDPVFNDAANNDYTLKSCSPALNVGDNTANTSTTDLADNPRKFNTTIDMGAYEFQAATATCCPFSTTQPIFVKHNAAGNNDGTTWANAYTDLQDAIDNWCGSAEIWVAAGTYKPTKETDGTTDTPREFTFYINQDGIKIYGGFAGTEPVTFLLANRDFAANTTTLSGDFDDNDVVTGNGATLSFSGNTENAYHVVYVDGTSSPVTIATVIDGFSIVEGNADGDFTNGFSFGGGILNSGDGGNSSPTIANCSFSNNNSAVSGGGIYNYGRNSGNSSPSITNCSFSNNSAVFGGGIYNDGKNSGNSNPSITNCSFSNNSASNDGSGIYNTGRLGNSSPTIANCSFSNNSAVIYGGGIYNTGELGNSSPTIANCSFSNNSANKGGGIYNIGDDGIVKSQIVNCLFNSNGAEHIYYDDGIADQQPHFINCTFTGATTRVITQNLDDGMTPLDFTNCIFWDNNGDITNLANTNVNINHSLIEEAGFTGGMNNIIAQDPLFTDAVNDDFTVQVCSPAIDVGDNTANTSTTALGGNNRKINMTIDMGAYEFQPTTATCCPFSATGKIYVDIDATAGNNDGTTWANAYTDLQDAIDNWCGGAEIWVAQGTYKPTKEKDGTTDTPREFTFYINQDGIKIYGGFAGTEPTTFLLANRDFAANTTTLSGDFDDNDVVTGNGATLSFSGNTENAYHVVYVDGTSSPVTIATVIDGFSIVEGNANGNDLNSGGGGGIYNDGGNGGNSSPSIANCSFSNNSASLGGGIYNDGGNGGNSSPSIANCSFSNNNANNIGGGIFNNGRSGNSSPSIANCSFSNNNTAVDGGGIYNDGSGGNSSPSIANCSFFNNSAFSGGGIANNGVNGGNSSPSIANCSFSNNNANNIGGGISIFGSGILKSQIVNCLFNSNGVEHIYYDDGNTNQQPHFINCTFTGATTRVIRQRMDSGMTPVDFTNCIFWDNGGDITDLANSNVNINHSLIEEAGFTGGMNNIINQDPLFTDAVNDDFTVQYCSPAIDAGDNTANTSTTALGGNNRKINSTIDMGAYEYNGPICPSISIAATTASVSELNTNKLIYQFTRQDGDLTQSLEVHFQISNSSTASAADYTVTEMGTGMVDFNENTLIGTITFPANQTTVVLEIVPQIDGTIESNETIVVEVIAAP